MALATLTFEGIDENGAQFELDIGTNKFYKLKIGRNIVNVQGLKLVDDVVYETPLAAGPNFNVFKSRFSVTIPADRFSGQPNYVQLFSFKDEKKKSPAVSEIVRVLPGMNLISEDLPAMTSTSNMRDTNRSQPAIDGRFYRSKLNTARAISFSFKEAAFSTPMFWDALIEAARLLTPSAVNALANLVGAGGGQSTNNENIVRVISAIIESLEQGQTPGTPNSAALPSTQVKSALSAPVLSKSQSHSKDYLPFQRRILRDNDAHISTRLSRTQFAAAALIPFLGPILQQAPQLLQVLADSPVKLLNVLNEAVNQQGQMQLQKKMADQQHIERLLGESLKDFLFLQQILRSAASASPAESPLSPSGMQNPMSFGLTAKPISTIIFQKDNPITVNGKPKYVYSKRGSIKLLAHLNILDGAKDAWIAKAIAELCIKDAVSRKILLEKSFKLKDVALNSIQELELAPSEVESLPINRDLMTSVTARYIDAGGKPHRCSGDTHLIFIAGDYIYKGIGDKIRESIPLDDKTKYRIFWNKIWEGGTRTKRRWQVSLTTKYYIYYRYDQSTNGRVETKIQQVQPEDEAERELNIEGRMKSGLEVAPNELNNLLSLAGSYDPLDDARLEAFKTDELGRDYNSEALTLLKMKGKTEETGMVWTYPDIGFFEFTLNKISEVNQFGQVTSIEEEKVPYPKPVNIHFVGEKTRRPLYGVTNEEEYADSAEGSGVEPIQSEGYERIFDIKVELRPVDLAPIQINVKP